MHKILSHALVVSAIAASLSASAYTTATVSYLDGSPETTVGITDDTTWKFADGMLNFAKPEGSVSFRMGNIASIKFVTDNVGVEQVAAPEGSLSLRQNPVRDLITVDGYAGGETRLEVFSTAGQQVMAIPSWQGEPVDASSLAKGLYILKINNQTFKFIKL